MESEQKESNGNKPVKKFRAGGVSATIWENKNKVGDTEMTFRTINLERNYKDKDGNWKSTNTMKVSDLQKVKIVCDEAERFLLLKDEKEKGE